MPENPVATYPPSLLRGLAEVHGDRFFIFRADLFRSNVERFLRAFQCRYPKTQIAYSYKTNYLPAVCKLADELGCLAEVVSGMELELALRLGIPGERIIFNGPLKTEEEIARAARQGALLHVDSVFEATQLLRAAESFPDLRFRTGVRCAFHIPGTSPTRFGIDMNDPAARRVFETLRRADNIALESLHAHYLPAGRTPQAYARITRTPLDLAAKHLRPDERRLIDVGGGFFSPMPESLRRQFSAPVPGFEEYGRAVGGAMAAASPESNGPWLILEPGLAVVADAFHYICRVAHEKHVLDSRYVVTTGSIDDMVPTRARKNMPLSVIPASNGRRPSGKVSGPVNIAGYTCREDDLLYRGYSGQLAPGDFLVFGNTGAYSIVLRPPFIRLAPPVLEMRSPTCPAHLIRRAETVEDLLRTSITPPQTQQQRGEHEP